MKPPTPTTCPTLQLARLVADESRQLNSDLHRLRHAMTACERCPQPCAQLDELHSATDAAIREIAQQWDL